MNPINRRGSGAVIGVNQFWMACNNGVICRSGCDILRKVVPRFPLPDNVVGGGAGWFEFQNLLRPHRGCSVDPTSGGLFRY